MIMYVKTPNLGTLNMREQPNTGSVILTKIPNGTLLEAKIEGDWARVTYNSKTGYVMNEYLSKENTNTVTKQDLQKVYDSLQNVLTTIENILKRGN